MHTGYEEDRELCGDSDRCGENIARIEGPLILYEEIGGFLCIRGRRVCCGNLCMGNVHDILQRQ